MLHLIDRGYGRARAKPRLTVMLCIFLQLVPTAQKTVAADTLPQINVAARKPPISGFTLPDPGARCRAAVAAAGRQYGIPDHVMAAIAQVESGRRMPDGQMSPWPWSLNAAGEDHVFDTREAAIASVRQFQAAGVKSIDVGCMQVNLLHHPQAFATLEAGFEPETNAAYAARFLHELFVQTGSWAKAIANYHSATPELGEAYRRRVMQVLAQQVRAGPAWAHASPMSPAALESPTAAQDELAAVKTPSGGGVMLGNRSEQAKILPQASTTAGRGLDAYRARPVRVAGRNL